MCLGIPGKITAIGEEDGVLMGKVDFGGVTWSVCLAYLPEAQVGDYAIIHAGFAISQLDEAEAQHTLALLQELEEEPLKLVVRSPLPQGRGRKTVLG